MKRIPTTLFAAIIIIASVPVFAQDMGGIEPGSIAGLRELSGSDEGSSTATNTGERALAMAESDPIRFRFIPQVVRQQDVVAGGLSADYLTEIASVAVQMRLGYSRAELENLAARNTLAGRVGADILSSQQLIPGLGGTTATALVSYGRTFDLQHRIDAKLALDQAIDAGANLLVGGNIAYVTVMPDIGQSTSAPIAAVGATARFNRKQTTLSIDYSFNNDIYGEDDWSATLSHYIISSSEQMPIQLIAGGGKHMTFFSGIRVLVR